MSSGVSFTIEELTYDSDPQPDVIDFLRRTAAAYEKTHHAEVFDPNNFSIARYLARAGGHMFLARRDGRPVGVMFARLLTSVFDSNLLILFQDLLYVESGNSRATKMLMQYFIDFGKKNANHLITMITEGTNIKPRSLERLGFSELETLYRMRV